MFLASCKRLTAQSYAVLLCQHASTGGRTHFMADTNGNLEVCEAVGFWTSEVERCRRVPKHGGGEKAF